jgi:hypothetical protein
VKTCALIVSCLFVASCGGGSKPKRPYAPPDPADEGPTEYVEPIEDEEEEEPPPPPPPQVWYARADLAPVKGAKVKASSIVFAQTEGESTQITGELPGLKAGGYHLVIHEAATCGKNATKAGAPWDGAADAPIELTVAKGETAALDQAIDLMLDGESSIIGRTLVLHADKKGKAGKAMACGPIIAEEISEEPAEDDDAEDE